jgi:CubicO group peptidase (beta-lactamase class C family)
MRKILPCLAITVLTSSLLKAGDQRITRLDGSTITPAEVDGTVTRLMKAAEVTGLGIAIFNKGKIAYLKTYGARDNEKNLPLTVDSVMSAASFSKVAFGYLALELADEGLLDLDKPVYQYLPKPLAEYPNYADLANDTRSNRITARMLLSHTSGFESQTDLFSKVSDDVISFEVDSQTHTVKMILHVDGRDIPVKRLE